MNTFPTKPSARRFAHILEHRAAVNGGYDHSTSVLRTLLSHAGMSLEEGFVGDLSDPVQLATDLKSYDPHFIVLWEQHGALLRAFGTHKRSLDDWAGYVWETEALLPGMKCMAVYGPGRVQQEWRLTGIVKAHLQKAVREAAADALAPPTRNIHHGWTKQSILNQLALLRVAQAPVALDIEGGCGMGPACIGFAWSAHEALVVPFYDVNGVSLWSEVDEVDLWEGVRALLEDPLVPKVIQNALYELFVLAWTCGIVIEGLRDDTMVKGFELHAELEKSLEFLACLYTRQPYWKLEHRQVEGRYVPFKGGKRATTEEWLVYNGTDCCVTYEINEVMDRKLQPRQREHYAQLNMQLLIPLAYMSLRGLRYDDMAAKRRLAETQQQIYELQDEINREAAHAPGREALRDFYAALDGSEGTEACSVTLVQPPSGSGAGGPEDAGRLRELLPALSTTSEGGIVDRPGQAAVAGVEPDAACEVAAKDDTVGESGTGSEATLEARFKVQTVEALLPLLTAAFCQARRTEEREVEEVSYQPMRWSRKGKWVKAGKRKPACPEAHEVEEAASYHSEEPDPNNFKLWFKRHAKRVKRNVAVAVTTLEAVLRFAKDSCWAECEQALQLVGDFTAGRGDAAKRGQLATLLGIHVKVNGTGAGGDAQWYLYDFLGLPKQYQKEGSTLTDRLASDDEAIIKSWVHSGKTKEKRNARALPFLKMRRMLTQTKFLCAEPDDDGRIRSGMNLVATPTCRMAMYGSPTGGSDLNLQTIGKGLRDLFVADEGCFIYTRDLDNSDAWSVAAYCKMLGDPTMLEDAEARLKPAKILARIYEDGPSINQLNRQQLKAECVKVDGEGWLYFACKRILHGSNYLMGKVTMANQILTDSYKLTGEPVYLDSATCERIQKQSFFVRYPGVQRWHAWMKREIAEKGMLVTSTGFQRRIFGRKDSHDTLKECLAHYPQYYTTWSVKMSLLKQWTDVENRREDGSLRVEPLLLVHDSNVGQAPLTELEFARRKLTEWFVNPVIVAGTELTIPASSTWGLDWKHQDKVL